jgi:hypothetical protein
LILDKAMTHAPGRNFTRERIAQLAARLIAEDGIEDYALAKRKAARQAGVPDKRQLPNNEEIDAELRLYRELFQKEHAMQLRELRLLALEVMNEFDRFNPYLTGSALTGGAGKYAGIQLQLFTDDTKSVEHYLLERRSNFRSGQTRLYAGDMELVAPIMSFVRNGVEIRLTVLSLRELRSRLKASAAGKPIERARREAVEAMIAAAD